LKKKSRKEAAKKFSALLAGVFDKAIIKAIRDNREEK